MLTRHIFRIATRACTGVLALLLAGCLDHSSYDIIASNQLATKDIGYKLEVHQDEQKSEISVRVRPFSTIDGLELEDEIHFSSQDVLSMSVQGQEVVPKKFSRGDITEFIIPQTSVNLPATFVIKLTRDGVREDALETYITLDAVFETTLPSEGAIIARDSVAEFAWTLRDGDGNAMCCEYAISKLYSYKKGVEQKGAIVSIPFVEIDTTEDGLFRYGRLPALELIQPQPTAQTSGPWDVVVTLLRSGSPLPVTFNIDPALANNRSLPGVYNLTSSVTPKSVNVTIR